MALTNGCAVIGVVVSGIGQNKSQNVGKKYNHFDSKLVLQINPTKLGYLAVSFIASCCIRYIAIYLAFGIEFWLHKTSAVQVLSIELNVDL